MSYPSHTPQERYNLSSYDFDAALFEGWIPRGYTTEEPFDDDYTQPFATKDIVLVSTFSPSDHLMASLSATARALADKTSLVNRWNMFFYMCTAR